MDTHISRSKVEKFVAFLLKWFQVNGRHFPWRETKNPYAILIAEIMLTQTQAEVVEPVYKAFMKEYPELKIAARGKLEKMEKIMYPLGLAYRAKRIKQICKAILEKHDGVVPDTEDMLLALPGIGPYTARAIMCFAYEQPVALLDTNIKRVLCRFFGREMQGEAGYIDNSLWDFARLIAPEQNTSAYNYATLDYGSEVCTHHNPDCGSCLLRSLCCTYSAKERVDFTKRGCQCS